MLDKTSAEAQFPAFDGPFCSLPTEPVVKGFRVAKGEYVYLFHCSHRLKFEAIAHAVALVVGLDCAYVWRENGERVFIVTDNDRDLASVTETVSYIVVVVNKAFNDVVEFMDEFMKDTLPDAG